MSSAFGNPVRKFLGFVLACSLGLSGYLYWVRTRTSSRPMAQSEEAALEPLQEGSPKQARSLTYVDSTPAMEHGVELPAGAPGNEPSGKAFGSETSSNALKTPPAKSDTKQIFFRYGGADSNFGKLALIDYPDGRLPRFVSDFSCEVVSFAGSMGICLTADQGVFPKYGADLFDAAFTRRSHFDLQGLPSRARVSPDGTVAALTVFLSGHSYASVDFSTQTLLIDTTRGQVLGDLEDFAVTMDGRPFQSPDFNFWGVTFTPDSKGFYCTLSSKGKQYLVKGEIKSKTLVVIRDNVECPSLSPDGTKIAYKKRNYRSWLPPPEKLWKLFILELDTMKDAPLVELRSVDDQLAWLDNSHVLYALPAVQADSRASTDVWVAPIDGSTPPKVFLHAAYSPSVVP